MPEMKWELVGKRKAKPPGLLCSSCLGKEEELEEEGASKRDPKEGEHRRVSWWVGAVRFISLSFKGWNQYPQFSVCISFLWPL